jgi:hypothetical protein
MKRNTVESQSLHDVRRKACAAVEAAIQNHFLLKTTPRNQFNIMKKNAKPILGGYACVRFPFFRILTVAFLLAATSLAWAQDPVYPTQDELDDMLEWDGTTTNGEFKIVDDMEIGIVDVESGTLKLYPVGHRTITKISERDNGINIFYTTDNGKLWIIGNKDNTLSIYGNCGNGTEENPTPIPTQTSKWGAGVLLSGNSHCVLKHVVFYGFVTNTGKYSSGTSNHNTNQGGIVTMTYNTSGGSCVMDHVTFRHSYGGCIDPSHNSSYGRIISFVNGTWNVTMDSVKIHDCLISEPLNGHYIGTIKIGGMGSVIRSQGQVGGQLIMRKCVAYNNTYRDLSAKNDITLYQSMDEIYDQPLSGQGGVVNWRSGRIPLSGESQVRLEDCKFHDNSAQCGGAVATCAAIKMKDT